MYDRARGAYRAAQRWWEEERAHRVQYSVHYNNKQTEDSKGESGKGHAEQGRECYERARVAEMRYVHLYGTSVARSGPSSSNDEVQPVELEAEQPLPVLEYFRRIAHAAYSQPGSTPLFAIEIDVRIMVPVEGLPRREVAEFANALEALSLARGGAGAA